MQMNFLIYSIFEGRQPHTRPRSTHIDVGEDDTVFEEAQVIFEKIKESSIDIILSRVPGLQMKHCLHC